MRVAGMLTDAKAKNAKAAAKPYKLADSGGLYLHVTPAGGKFWRCRYEMVEGGKRKEKLLTFGRYPVIGLADARAARDAARDARHLGHDPADVRRKAAQAKAEANGNTFERVARAWHAQTLPTWRDRHADDVIRSLERDVFPTLGTVPIRDITPPMVLAALREIEARPAIETAHRIRQRMSAVFVHAIASGICENDPAAIVAAALKPVAEKARQPAVTDLDGVREILAKAEAIPAHPGTRLALRLLALTAVRGGEIRGAKPAEFEGLDGPEPVWRIPAERMKGRIAAKSDKDHAHVVPLSRQAVETVKAALRVSGPRAPLLFPSVRHAHKPMSENAIGYLLNRAGYHGHHVPHGFRSAFSTIMNERYRDDRVVIDMMLSHAPKDKVEAAYNRAQWAERRRELAQIWADMLMEEMLPAASLLSTPRR